MARWRKSSAADWLFGFFTVAAVCIGLLVFTTLALLIYPFSLIIPDAELTEE